MEVNFNSVDRIHFSTCLKFSEDTHVFWSLYKQCIMVRAIDGGKGLQKGLAIVKFESIFNPFSSY